MTFFFKQCIQVW